MKITKVLITGANAGLGKECARQLAELDSIEKIYLGCRSPAKAEAAKTELEELTGCQNKFEIVIIDVCDLESVQKAVESIPAEVGLDGLVLNAGGAGPDPLGESKVEGVCNIVALNLLGHVHLTNLLLASKKLQDGGTVVYSGSEAGRGIPNVVPPPDVDGSVDAFKSICDGSIVNGDADKIYAYVKMMAALWIGCMARSQANNIRFVTMSPGACAGTDIMKYNPLIKRVLLTFMMQVYKMLGKGHTIEVGAKRYVDALMEEEKYKSGVFYASREGLTGAVSDQSEGWDIFTRENYQDAANTTIAGFLSS
eukprot:CAMPEP_0194040412 /NCGR_PEP_ID=MMETSP0009_2-20130614/12424_1 /TAXON_ID=210454 /ORGANISM="Grammatophora oceanica, Strain CCMP 410" /LENGTH=309 /DNA_ID=CAMNT_0038683551 /DNA_START=9 /DNA_END=938 /DNA_ORIENTATION=-